MWIVSRIYHVWFLRAISGIIIAFNIAIIQVGVHLTIGRRAAPIAHLVFNRCFVMPLVGALIHLELVLNFVFYLLCRHHLFHFLFDHLAFKKCCWLVLQLCFVYHLKILLILIRLVSVCKPTLHWCLIRLVKILIFNVARKKHVVVHIVNSIDCWALVAV